MFAGNGSGLRHYASLEQPAENILLLSIDRPLSFFAYSANCSKFFFL